MDSKQFDEFINNPKNKTVVGIASCLAFASMEQGRVRGHVEPRYAREFHPSIDNVYWETREAALKLSGKLRIFYPHILFANKYIVQFLSSEEIEKRSKRFWPQLMSPTLLVLDVMES